VISPTALVLPIIVSAVAVFVLSAIIHMALKYHASDFAGLPNEDAVRTAIRSGNPPPGQYFFPHAREMSEMKTPEMQKKLAEGPNGMLVLRAPGMVSMGSSLLKWFLFVLLVSCVIAYVACHTLQLGSSPRHVFRVIGTVGFLAYAMGHVPEAIWYGRSWSATLKDVFDGLIYGLATGAVFALLWPH
jgi:hypothetical protein